MSFLLHYSKMFTILSLLIFLLYNCEAQRFRCDYSYDHDANAWFKLHVVPATWHEAQLRCHLEGGVLASPLTEKIGQSMKAIMKNNSVGIGIFTGIHATFSRGDFFSIEGMPLEKIPIKWGENEPDNYVGDEDCTIMTPDGNISDVNCKVYYRYICYKRVTPDLIWNEACGTSDVDYTYDPRTGHCYKFHREPRTWSRAYMTCAAEGGYLVIINSEEEVAVIRNLFEKNPVSSLIGKFDKNLALIGIHDWYDHGTWRTIQGQTLAQAGYSKFAQGQPDNSSTGEFCGSVFRTVELNDIWCENAYAFICEKSPFSLCPETKHNNDYDF